VVPKRRCAAPIAAIPATVGDSLNSTPPPPLTWVSMKPGKQHRAAEDRCRRVGGNFVCGMIAADDDRRREARRRRREAHPRGARGH
jgi:hypothetical protein